ncbi:MAG: GTPase HflX [Clostridiales bacterium]|nr:GTPase HflX [Clostridiales bacterium]
MKVKVENVALVYVELPNAKSEQDLYEIKELINTAQGEIKLYCTQKRDSIDPTTVLGKGKLDELKRTIEMLDCDIDVVIFSCNLNATQRAFLTKTLDCDVIDRIDLILDIFAMRATSAEGKKQVELAQLTYNLATKPEGDFSRQGAGIGTRGPGETKLETNKRLARDRIHRLKLELKEIESHRNLTRKKRRENGIFTVALVGYTNAGKSTLFNRLTQSDVYADDKLFATLDTTVRKTTLDNGIEILLCDTVGFIKDLPHTLINAFKSTLEEATRADLLLNVCDASDENVADHIATTEATLSELGATAQIIRVYNKCDKLSTNSSITLASDTPVSSVFISSLDGKNIDILMENIKRHVATHYSTVKIRVPLAESARMLSLLHKFDAQCQSVEYLDEYTEIKVVISKKYIDLIAKYIVF